MKSKLWKKPIRYIRAAESLYLTCAIKTSDGAEYIKFLFCFVFCQSVKYNKLKTVCVHFQLFELYSSAAANNTFNQQCSTMMNQVRNSTIYRFRYADLCSNFPFTGAAEFYSEKKFNYRIPRNRSGPRHQPPGQGKC